MTKLIGAALIYQPTRDMRVDLNLCRAAVWKRWRFFQCTRLAKYTHAGLKFCTTHARLARMNGGRTR